MQQILAVSALLALSGWASPNPHDFYEDSAFYTSYIAEFGKHYKTIDEFRVRMELFSKT